MPPEDRLGGRRSLRLSGYDYSQPGMYFVTVCTARNAPLLGAVHRGRSRTTKAGGIVRRVWEALPRRFPWLRLDAFVVMPRHVHGVLVFQPSRARVGRASPAPTAGRENLGSVIAAFKSQSAIEVNRLLKRSGPVWQRNYYEHIVRGGQGLDEIRRYILDNPVRWAWEREHME